MSVFDEYVREAHPEAVAERLIAARRRLQYVKPWLRTGSAYANILGAIACAKLQDGLRRTSGLQVAIPEEHVRGDVLGFFLTPSIRSECARLEIMPLGPNPQDRSFDFAGVDRTATYDPAFRTLLTHTPFEGMEPTITRVVPQIHLRNHWDTLGWLTSFDNFASHDRVLPNFLAPDSPFFGDLRRAERATFESRVVDSFATSISREKLCLGSTRLARRILRALALLLSCEDPPAPEPPHLRTYRIFMHEFLYVLGLALRRTTPLVPALHSLGITLSQWTHAVDLDAFYQSLPALRAAVRGLLVAADADDESTLTHLRRAVHNSTRLVVYGCPSLVVRSALNLCVLLNEPQSVTFVMTEAMGGTSRFAITSRFFADCLRELTQGTRTTVELIGLQEYLGRARDRHFAMDARLFTGVTHFVGDGYALCERGVGQAASTVGAQQAYAFAGGRSKRLENYPADHQKRMVDQLTSEDGAYLRLAMREYELMGTTMFWRIYAE